MQAVIVAIVLLWVSSATARRSAATQAGVDQCMSLGEAPMQEDRVWLNDELFQITAKKNVKDYDPIPFDKMHPSMLVSAACTLVQRLHTGLDQLRHLLMLDHLFMARMDLSLHSSYASNTKSSVLSQRRKIAYEMLVLPFSSNNSDFCALVPCNEYGSNFCRLRSEIYSADAMGYFTKMSIFNDAQLRVLGNKMAAELLVSGVGNDAETRYKKFRGRPVSTDHFVAHLNV